MEHLKSGESNRPLTPILLESIANWFAIHLPFLSRCFCKSMSFSWQIVVYTPPIYMTIRLPFVSRCSCRSVRVRGRWNTPNKTCSLEMYAPRSRRSRCFDDGKHGSTISDEGHSSDATIDEADMTLHIAMLWTLARRQFLGLSSAPWIFLFV